MNKNYNKVILDNGIRLYVHGDKSMKKTSFSYTVKYGSSGEFYKFNYDGKDYEVLPGCAHFLEHLLLEQSKYGNLYTYFQSLKFISNANTGDIRTKYYFSGIKNIKSSIKKIIDALENPIFNEKMVREASHAIEEETKRGLDDSFWLTIKLSMRNLYKDFDYTHETLNSIGNEETTKSIHEDMLKLCYNAFYYDENKIITIVGPFDEEDMINYIKKIYSRIKKHENKTKLIIPNDLSIIRKKEDYLVTNMVEDPYLIIGYKFLIDKFSLFEISFFISYIAFSKLSNNTKFYQDNKKDGVLVEYFGQWNNPVFNKYYNVCFIYTVKDKDKFIKAFDKQMKIKDFDRKDFELYKKGAISNYLYSLDNKYYYYDMLPEYIVKYNKEIEYIDEVKNFSFDRFLEFYDTIDIEDKVITLHTKEGLLNG